MGLIGFVVSLLILVCLAPILLISLLCGGGGYWIGQHFGEGWGIFGAMIGALFGISVFLQA